MTVHDAVSGRVERGARARTLPAPDDLVVAWQHPSSRLISPVGLLDQDGEDYRFRYLRSATGVVDFQPFVGFPRWQATYRARELFPLFAQRVMSPRRPDYLAYLRQLNLTPDPSPWEILARSEGRRTGDTVQVFPVPSVEADGHTRCSFLVHGVRWVLGDAVLPVRGGDVLALADEPTNPVSSRAVMVVDRPGGTTIGYVPHLLLDHLEVVRKHGPIALRAEHVNGPESPPHLRVLAQLAGTVPAGYRPMSGPGWETFSSTP